MIRICAAYSNYRDSNSALLFFLLTFRSDLVGMYVNTLSFSSSLHLCLCQLSLFSVPFPSLSLATSPLKFFPPLFVYFRFHISRPLSPSNSLPLSAEAKPHPSVKRAKCWRHTKTTYPAAVKSYFNLNIHSMEREEKVD